MTIQGRNVPKKHMDSSWTSAILAVFAVLLGVSILHSIYASYMSLTPRVDYYYGSDIIFTSALDISIRVYDTFGTPAIAVGILGCLLPMTCSVLLLVLVRDDLRAVPRSVLAASVAAMAVQFRFCLVSPYGIYSTPVSWGLYLLVIMFLSSFVLKTGPYAASAIVASVAILSSVTAELLAVILTQTPYGSIVLFVGGRGLTGVIWHNAIVAVLFLNLAGLTRFPRLDDALLDPRGWATALRVLWHWLQFQSKTVKVILLILPLMTSTILALGVSIAPVRVFEQVYSSWGTNRVNYLGLNGPYLLVGTNREIYFTDAFGFYSEPYVMEFNHYISGIATSSRSQLTYGSNVTRFFVATYEYQAALKCVEMNATPYSSYFAITDLELASEVVNETSWELALTSEGETLFMFNWRTGIWRYDVASSNMTPLSTPMNLTRAYITFFETVESSLVVGIRGAGFWVYNNVDDIWLRPDDEVGCGTEVTAVEFLSSDRVLYVGSINGLLMYSLNSTSVDHIATLSPVDGFPNLHVTALHYDYTVDALVVATYGGTALYYPEESRVDIQEETMISYMEDYVSDVLPVWYMGTYHLYLCTYKGRLFRLSVNVGSMNLSFWNVINTLQQNLVTIAFSVIGSSAILWFSIKPKKDEKTPSSKTDENN